MEAVGGLLAREGRASPKTFHLVAEPELLLRESSLPLSKVANTAIANAELRMVGKSLSQKAKVGSGEARGKAGGG